MGAKRLAWRRDRNTYEEKESLDDESNNAICSFLLLQCIDHDWPQLVQSVDEISFPDLVALCSRSFACLNKSQFSELRVAGELYDACMSLKEEIAASAEKREV